MAIKQALKEVTDKQLVVLEQWYLEKLVGVVPEKYLADPTRYKDVINAIVEAEGYWLEVSTHCSWDDNVARIQYVWKKKK